MGFSTPQAITHEAERKVQTSGEPIAGRQMKSDDLNAHRAGSAFDLKLGGFHIVGVEVGQLNLRDLLHLGLGDRARHL